MNTHIFSFLILLIPAITSAQTIYVEGYIIDMDNNRSACLILNEDWENAPDNFKYKMSEGDSDIIGTTQTIREFGVTNDFVYRRGEVQIDQSSSSIREMSRQKAPEFIDDTVFLKVLVEGAVSLLMHKKKETHFYMSIDNSSPEALVFKEYLRTNTRISDNNYFRQQLFTKFQGCITESEVSSLKYQDKQLVRIFKKYNECLNSSYTDYYSQNIDKRKVLHLNLRAGVYNSSLEIDQTQIDRPPIEFGNKNTIAVGVEAEFVLPFNNNKWTIIASPMYQRYSGESSYQLAANSYKVKVDYSSIELFAGVRHRFFLSESSVVFLNAFWVFTNDLNSKLDFETAQDIELQAANNFAFGAGYQFKNLILAEVRFQTERDVLNDYIRWYSKYSVFSISLGYRLF